MKVHIYTKTEGEDFIMDISEPADRQKLATRMPLLLEDSGGFDMAVIDTSDETIELDTMDELLEFLQN